MSPPSCGRPLFKASEFCLGLDPLICLVKFHHARLKSAAASCRKPSQVASFRLRGTPLSENVSVLSRISLSRERGPFWDQGGPSVESQRMGRLALCQLGLHLEGRPNWPHLQIEK